VTAWDAAEIGLDMNQFPSSGTTSGLLSRSLRARETLMQDAKGNVRPTLLSQAPGHLDIRTTTSRRCIAHCARGS